MFQIKLQNQPMRSSIAPNVTYFIGHFINLIKKPLKKVPGVVAEIT